jgi:Ca2+-binding RTX toxin-like protein
VWELLVAHIVGTAGNDVINGTVEADRIEGGDGNDRINGGAGDDEIYGGAGVDILTGDAGNDRIFAGEGNDGVYGGGGNDYVDGGVGDDILIGDGGNDTLLGAEGNDRLYGGIGDDVLIGGAGNDQLYGEAGNDTFVWNTGDGSDTFNGGAGDDRLELHISAADVTAALRSDLEAYQAWSSGQLAAAGSPAALAGQTAGTSFTFASLGLTITVLETVAVYVDGTEVPIDEFVNAAPVAASKVPYEVDEDGVLEGVISATDPDGDALTFAVETGPSMGAVTIDAATGAFVYKPASDASGSDSFVVRVTDPSGAATTQTVTIDVSPVADAPVLSTEDVTAEVARVSTIHGTGGNDNLRGDQYASSVMVGLAIAAAMTDTDGSETMTIRIAGVPSGAALSAGELQTDGTWLLQPADLEGLELQATVGRDFALQVTAETQDGASVAAVSAVVNVAFERDGGSMDDTFIATAGNDVYDGGAGTNTVDYSGVNTAVSVNLANGTAYGPGNQQLISIDNVVGSAHSDTITGDDGDNVIASGAGHDRVNGGNGNDTFIDGAGDDRYDGGTGYDVLDYSASTRSITVEDGRVTGQGDDRYSNVEKVVGSNFSDTFHGGRWADTFDGGNGNDWFRGYGGSDIFTGGAGNDTFVWEERDVVLGRRSQGVDTITDFGGGDRLDLRDITGGLLGINTLLGVDPRTQIKVTDTAAGSMVSVKVGSSFYDVVLLQNVHGVTTASMLADGQLIA